MRTGKTRGRYAKSALKNRLILQRIKELKSLHPFWGYRRVWAWLKYKEEFNINHKRVYDLMRENDLTCKKENRNKALRLIKPKPKAQRINQYFGIDMTKVKTPTGWVYITIVLDWYTKKVVGYHIGLQSKSRDWISALDMALNAQFPSGARGHDLKLVSDNGCQPTSLAFMKYCCETGVHQIFSSFCNPKGNAETERFMRTIKEECCWLQDWDSFDQLQKAIVEWIDFYNNNYLHSSLGYKSPLQVEICSNPLAFSA